MNLNLGLIPNVCNNYGEVYGVIKNTKGVPIKNSLIKIINSKCIPILYTITNNKGIYCFNNIPAGKNYKIFATFPGKKLDEVSDFSIKKNDKIKINFILQNNSIMNLGIISGKVLNSITNEPIIGAVISLIQKNINNYPILDSMIITYTNKNGEYLFKEVDIGCYIIKITALGYFYKCINIIINNKCNIYPMIVNLIPNTSPVDGTVSGIITDKKNIPITRADVILYKVENNKNKLKNINLTPVAYTKTNKSGVYLFINVPKGIYKIKANKVGSINHTLKKFKNPQLLKNYVEKKYD